MRDIKSCVKDTDAIGASGEFEGPSIDAGMRGARHSLSSPVVGAPTPAGDVLAIHTRRQALEVLGAERREAWLEWRVGRIDRSLSDGDGARY